jgi:hypothetical protein
MPHALDIRTVLWADANNLNAEVGISGAFNERIATAHAKISTGH